MAKKIHGPTTFRRRYDQSKDSDRSFNRSFVEWSCFFRLDLPAISFKSMALRKCGCASTIEATESAGRGPAAHSQEHPVRRVPAARMLLQRDNGIGAGCASFSVFASVRAAGRGF